jgi:hypothetical protein
MWHFLSLRVTARFNPSIYPLEIFRVVPASCFRYGSDVYRISGAASQGSGPWGDLSTSRGDNISTLTPDRAVCGVYLRGYNWPGQIEETACANYSFNYALRSLLKRIPSKNRGVLTDEVEACGMADQPTAYLLLENNAWCRESRERMWVYFGISGILVNSLNSNNDPQARHKVTCHTGFERATRKVAGKLLSLALPL